MPGDFKEDMSADASNRRELMGNNLFENLGDPIKNILLQLTQDGKEVDQDTLQLLQHITVKQLAKVFDMLNQEEDPETILAWLKRRARKNRGGEDDWKEERKKLVSTGAERDPIAFYKAIEDANAAKAEEYQQMEEERAQLRMAKAKEREKSRKKKQDDLVEAKKAIEDEGGWWKATDHMPEKDKNAINNAFEKFATKNSDFDNADKDQDGEWWKRDPFRRDWERHKGKGKKWTAVIEAAKDKATDAELAVREEFYKGNDWWKADRYKRDWDATKDNEWWKEEPYIKDWQQNKHEGARWKAADEESGLESEGHTYPATPEEQKRREEWYKANGPSGVVKKWNSATEGDPEKCSVPEKHAREEFYRNGDWWKNDDARQDFKDKGLDCDAMKFAAQPKDPEWWKQEPYREDYFKNGDKGKKWPAINEEVGIDDNGDKKPAPSIEKQKREDWYKANWWKQPEHKDDWKKNGKNGKTWKAPSEKDAKAGNYSKPVGPAEQRAREDWYRNADEEWWKQPQYIEDYFQKGDEGRHWPGKTEEDGKTGKALESPCNGPEKKKREDWYKTNWWKQPKYTDDFHKNGALGDAWCGKNDEPKVDKEWWKQGPFIENWSKTHKQKTAPEGSEWWKQPQYVEDFHRLGPKGKKWNADNETHGAEGSGDKNRASPDEKKQREHWYGNNWWTAPQHALDWATQGPRGETWKSAEVPEAGKKGPEAPEDVKGQRENWYRPIGDMWRACGEEQGFAKKAAENPCTPAEAIRRDEWYRQNWWKAPEYVEDWKKNGSNGKKWAAGNEEAGKKGEGDKDPASPEEQQLRDNWFRNAGDNEWWKEPQYCEDWAHNGPEGAMWTADNRPNANRGGGKEHPCPEKENADRDAWYKDNWWKTPTCHDDWKKNGKAGPMCGRKKPLTTVDRQDPETIGEGWWKKPEYIEDWLKNGEGGKHWTGDDPVSAAAGLGHKKPATDPEKDKREKWYKDNWWKAPSCADDWAKKGATGKKWGAVDPDATRGENGDSKPATDPEKDKREDWYRKHGDGDDWWKRPEFIDDYQNAGPSGKKWTAGNPTAGALGLGHDCPASGPEKKKREDWYKDNWWKAPEVCDDWAKGPAGEEQWKKDNPSPEEQKKRDDWYRANKGVPAEPEEQNKRDAWYRKHGKEPSGPQLEKREDWYRKQMSDDDKAKRMDWLRDRGDKEKRILADELGDALAAINEGQVPTEDQIQAVKDQIEWNRKGAKDDFGPEGSSGRKRGVADDESEPEETIGQDEFFKAVADTNFYVAPDADEREMQAEEEKADQEREEMTRQEEEAAYLAMDAEEELAKKPEDWQRNYVDPENEEWWKKPEYIEQYQRDPEDTEAPWRMEGASGKKRPVADEEQDEREQWMKDNWWKAPKHSTEWRRDGEGGEAWKKSAKPEEDDDGMTRDDDETPEATPEEIKEREDWFKNARNPEREVKDPEAAADEWWKKPSMIEDFQDGGDEWNRGADEPEEQQKREEWLKDNWWKAPKQIEEWTKAQKEDPEKQTWKRSAAEPEEEDDGMNRTDEEAAPEVVAEREAWYKQAVEPFHGEKLQDDDFKGEKLDDPFTGEKLKDDDFKGEKLDDPFTGEKLKDDDFKGEKLDDDFKGEKLDDDFKGEKLDDPFTGEKLKDDDFKGEKMDEPFEGEKVDEPFEGEKVDEPFEGEKVDDPFAGEKFVNEDDAEDDPEWEDPEEEMDVEDPRVDDEEDADEEEAPAEDEEDAWAEMDDEEEPEGEEEEEEESDGDDDNEHQDDEDLEAELEAALEEQEAEWEEDDDEDEEEEDMAEPDDAERGSDFDEDDEEPEKPPEPWMLPLPEVTNNIYLKSYFPVLKWNPNKAFGPADRRIWVVDHFAKSFYCLDAKGKTRRQHDANKLLQLERNVMDPRRARLMFFDAAKSYEIVFPSNDERERFYETGSSIRPAIRVYAPSLTKPDTAVDGGSTTTTIDGTKENAVVQKVPNPFKKTGELLDRELQGRCKINSSKVQDEPVSVWCGSFNMCGSPPPRDSSTLESWIPKGKYDLYAVGTQECSYQKEEGEWFTYVQEYLGKDYLTLASMQLWDITVVVLCKKKCLLKITNVEGSTKATLHKEKCGMKGAAGICLKFHNTSMAFISCHLAARMERTKMRKINIEEICNQIQLANKDCDLSSQFHHVFWMGDMNYRVEMENAEATPLLESKKYIELLNQDQLLNEIEEGNVMYGFKEAPITFPPTYRYKKGSSDYMNDRGRAPSYTDRILVKSMGNTTIKCTGYGAADVHTSEHMPVYATYVVRCVRPHMNCFHRDQEPRPQFEFSEITFIEQNHLMFRKPMMMVYSPFSEHPHKGKSSKTSTMKPSFTGESLPGPIKCAVQMTEYLEKHSLIIIFRDLAEPREDKMFRGAAVMELQGRVLYDEEQDIEVDVCCLSRKIGVIRCKFKVCENIFIIEIHHGEPFLHFRKIVFVRIKKKKKTGYKLRIHSTTWWSSGKSPKGNLDG